MVTIIPAFFFLFQPSNANSLSEYAHLNRPLATQDSKDMGQLGLKTPSATS